MAYVSPTDCCGMAVINEIGWEADSINGCRSIVNVVKKTLPTRAHYVFTQAGSGETYGKRFAAYIRKNKLGSVVRSVGRINPNSGNHLIAFIWTVSLKNLKSHK